MPQFFRGAKLRQFTGMRILVGLQKTLLFGGADMTNPEDRREMPRG